MENNPVRCTDGNHQYYSLPRRCIWVNGPVIIGAGPAGLATAACLRDEGVPFVVLERASCIGSLWQDRTYDRLKLHLPKQFCELPKIPFPEDYPEYPSRNQFIDYLESYAAHFDINPNFGECVQSARFDNTSGLWRVRTSGGSEYICRWLVVATGENAEPLVPEFEGLAEFRGEVIHAADYKSGEKFSGKRVLVVGCGNSGMEVSLDLCNCNALPSIVVRSSVHILPREVLGKSTFEIAVFLMRWVPIWLVDKLLIILARLFLGNLERIEIKRPTMGPLELKDAKGKTPVLDIGALEKIKSGKIKIIPSGIKRFGFTNRVEFVNGEKFEFDAVVLATGYRSNVPSWLKESEFFDDNGYPRSPFPNGWKGSKGLYAVGFTRRGLAGVCSDAIRVAKDIGYAWKNETKQQNKKTTSSSIACHRRSISQQF